jgi:hypothetical protein
LLETTTKQLEYSKNKTKQNNAPELFGRQGLWEINPRNNRSLLGFEGGKVATSANSELLIFKEIAYYIYLALFSANEIEFKKVTSNLGRTHFLTCSASPKPTIGDSELLKSRRNLYNIIFIQK